MIPIRPAAKNHVNLDEFEAIRNLKKKAIYKMLAETYLMPDKSSKGVNRRYLARVFQGTALRILIMEYKRFEVELTPAQLKKAPFICTGDVYLKLVSLLQEMKLDPLGFDESFYPEDTWLYKVVRVIDRSNATSTYLEQVPLRNPPIGVHPLSATMVIAKRNAKEYLIGNIRGVPAVYSALKSLWDAHKKVISRRVEIRALERELQASRENLTEEEPQISAALAKAGMVVFSSGYGCDADRIFIEGEQAQGARVQMAEITNL